MKAPGVANSQLDDDAGFQTFRCRLLTRTLMVTLSLVETKNPAACKNEKYSTSALCTSISSPLLSLRYCRVSNRWPFSCMCRMWLKMVTSSACGGYAREDTRIGMPRIRRSVFTRRHDGRLKTAFRRRKGV